MTRDETLSTQIKEALNRDGRVETRSIQVASSNGIVTLAGPSPSYGSILAAIEIVASFPKCRGVINRQVLDRSEARCAHRHTRSPCDWPAGPSEHESAGDAPHGRRRLAG